MKTVAGLMPLDLHDLNGMIIGESKNVLLASAHTRDGYYLGYTVSGGATQTGHGFASIDAMIETGETVKTDSSYIWTITKKDDDIFTLTRGGYTPYGDAEENVTWSNQEMDFALLDATKTALGATTYMSTGYKDKYCLRLVMESNSSLYLNMGGNAQSLKYYPGVQEWSVWYLLENKYKASTSVYHKESGEWKKISLVYYKKDDRWHPVTQIAKKVSGSWVS